MKSVIFFNLFIEFLIKDVILIPAVLENLFYARPYIKNHRLFKDCLDTAPSTASLSVRSEDDMCDR